MQDHRRLQRLGDGVCRGLAAAHREKGAGRGEGAKPQHRGPDEVPVPLGEEEKTLLSQGGGPYHSWGGWGAEEAPPQMQECSSKGPLDGSFRGLPLCGLQITPTPHLLLEAHQPVQPSW